VLPAAEATASSPFDESEPQNVARIVFMTVWVVRTVELLDWATLAQSPGCFSQHPKI